MIGPVSGTGRAMMASLQQAIQKGMPPEQAVQYVKSMATQGVAPLADLYAMLNQFQRLKQPQAQAPQTPPTIRDQLNALDQQQQMQQGASQQPMNRGLGAIDAGLMEYPQFAGGGIVAFEEGGSVESEVQRILEKSPYDRTPEENEILRAAGRQLSRRTLSENSGITKLNKFLESPFIRQAVSPYGGLSEEELVQQGGTGAINERIIRALGGDQLKSTPATPTPPIAPTTPAVTPSQSAVPPPAGGASPADFSAMLGRAQMGVRQDQAPAAPAAPAAPPAREVSTPRRPAVSTQNDPLKGLRDEFGGTETNYIDKNLADQEALEKRLGIGQYGEARKAREAQLAEAEKRTAKQGEEDRRLDRAEFFFNIAAQAAQPGATLFGSIAKAGPAFAKANRASIERLRGLQERAQEARLKMLEADELRKEGNVSAAQKMYAEGRQNLIKYGIDIYKTNQQIQGQLQVAQAYSSRYGTRSSVDSTRVKALTSALTNANRRVIAAQTALQDPMIKFDRDRRTVAELEVQKEQANLERIQAELLALGQDAEGVSSGEFGYEELPSGFVMNKR